MKFLRKVSYGLGVFILNSSINIADALSKIMLRIFLRVLKLGTIFAIIYNITFWDQ